MGGEHDGESRGLRGEGVPPLEVTGEELELPPENENRDGPRWAS